MEDDQETRVWVVNFVGTIIEARKKPLRQCAHPQIFTCADIYIYYGMLKEHMDCWHCLFRSYMIIALAINVLLVPLLILGLIFIYLHFSREIRIYATVLFVATWLQMMLSILFAQQYQTVGDVLRIWRNRKSLEFFESRCQCCGVLGPDDYKLGGLVIPLSCYKDLSGMDEDLFQSGCSTQSMKHSFPIIQVISFIVQYVLVICLKVFLYILIRSGTPRRSMRSERRSIGSLNP
ncbi:protein late bloomer isoform X3 [Drosophila teissieri]|uniref:protein late bloomer isoform X3 n=1 Tax=Drosophila teissieri TaxID=7243 RepID=UPI001CBA26BC|nr:protein late bloomer isoform X3 [Drosophila teissieri]